MVNMGCRGMDGLKKPGHKVKEVFGSIEKLLILGNLTIVH